MVKPIKILKERGKLFLIVFGLLANLGLALHQYEMFMRAYMSPQKAIALYIDVYGEANGELVLMTAAAILGIVATIVILWDIHKGTFKV
jgi:hypothetical protein